MQHHAASWSIKKSSLQTRGRVMPEKQFAMLQGSSSRSFKQVLLLHAMILHQFVQAVSQWLNIPTIIGSKGLLRPALLDLWMTSVMISTALSCPKTLSLSLSASAMRICFRSLLLTTCQTEFLSMLSQCWQALLSRFFALRRCIGCGHRLNCLHQL